MSPNVTTLNGPIDTNIEPLAKFLPPPFLHLERVVKNKNTGEVGFLYTKDGKSWVSWEFADERAASKELAKV
jgi:hypothetical protein